MKILLSVIAGIAIWTTICFIIRVILKVVWSRSRTVRVWKIVPLRDLQKIRQTQLLIGHGPVIRGAAAFVDGRHPNGTWVTPCGYGLRAFSLLTCGMFFWWTINRRRILGNGYVRFEARPQELERGAGGVKALLSLGTFQKLITFEGNFSLADRNPYYWPLDRHRRKDTAPS